MRYNSNSTFSFGSAKVVAKEEVACLRLKQLQEKHKLKHKQEDIDCEMQSWAPQIYSQFRSRKFRKTARGVPQPQIRKFAIGLR